MSRISVVQFLLVSAAISLADPFIVSASPPVMSACSSRIRPLNIQMAYIDDAGEASVTYPYEISRYEITNKQYETFLNSVATIDDPNDLFDPQMQTHVDGGIVRTISTNGYFCHQTKPHMANKPVNYVTWPDAARFVNWIENGQPNGIQDATTTEDGTYDLTIGDGVFYSTGLPNPVATWRLPDWWEWRKAAYYDGNGGFWDFATQSDTPPDASPANPAGGIAQPGPNVVNYQKEASWNNLTDGNVTTVGSCDNTSYYGTSDQNGNVAEWTEELTCLGGCCGRTIYGGSYKYRAPADLPGNLIHPLRLGLSPPHCDGPEPVYGENHRSGDTGFRVVRVD